MRRGGVDVYITECFDCMKIGVGWMYPGKGKANNSDTVVGVCYRLPQWEVEADKMFCKKVGKAS